MNTWNSVPFIASYSGGKDSVLAIHRAIAMGMELRGLLITYNTAKGRSWFHGIPREVLKEVAASVGVPVTLIETDGSDYEEKFEACLRQQKALGVGACVFGDIDIQPHLDWGIRRCLAAGLRACHPLWQQSREALVRECIETGYAPVITVVDARRLSTDFLGQTLTQEVMAQIEAQGADVCGENGEYHTFVVDGPIFTRPIPVAFGEVLMQGDYGVAPIKLK